MSDLDAFTAVSHSMDEAITLDSPPASIIFRYLSHQAHPHKSGNEFCHKTQAFFRKIGSGTCGSVFHTRHRRGCVHEEAKAYKFEKAHHFGENRGLANDWDMHVHINNALKSFGAQLSLGGSSLDVRLPRPIDSFSKSKQSWTNSERFPQLQQHDLDALPDQLNVLIMEHIPPVPRALQYALIEQYCPLEIKKSAYDSAANTDCLIRPYLGKVAEVREAPRRAFSLRNFGLYLDQFEELGLFADGPDGDFESSTAALLAQSMADALAIMHWSCGLDAHDVEFVLGGTSEPDLSQMSHESERNMSQNYNRADREVHLWLLDFNQVQPLPAQGSDEEKIERAVRSFQANDPYYPRPGRGPAELWETFKERYLETSEKIFHPPAKVGDSRRGSAASMCERLPALFIDAIERHQAERNAKIRLAHERLDDTDDEKVCVSNENGNSLINELFQVSAKTQLNSKIFCPKQKLPVVRKHPIPRLLRGIFISRFRRTRGHSPGVSGSKHSEIRHSSGRRFGHRKQRKDCRRQKIWQIFWWIVEIIAQCTGG